MTEARAKNAIKEYGRRAGSYDYFTQADFRACYEAGDGPTDVYGMIYAALRAGWAIGYRKAKREAKAAAQR